MFKDCTMLEVVLCGVAVVGVIAISGFLYTGALYIVPALIS